MQVRPARNSDISDITRCASRIREEYFEANNIPQWQNGYPSKEDFSGDIESGRLFVMYLGEVLIGFISVGFAADPCYFDIEDGAWSSSEPYAVVHRFGINPDWHRMGMGTALFGVATRLCEAKKVSSIRVDTHESNAAMIAFLEHNGFKKAGVIHLANGDPRLAFEKNL